MTKEELEKEANDYADEHAFRVPYDGSNKFYDDVDFKASKEGYLAGAEPREKRIEELEKENKVLRIHQTNAVLNGLEMKVLKDSHRDRANKLQNQITKAKEIIKELLDTQSCLDPYRDIFKDRILKAEQFLQEETK